MGPEVKYFFKFHITQLNSEGSEISLGRIFTKAIDGV